MTRRTVLCGTVVMLLFIMVGTLHAGDRRSTHAHQSIAASFRAELGILAIPYHTIQFGRDGDLFDYREQGGQEILYPYRRFTAEATFGNRHELELLYQPLTIESRTRIPENETLQVDNVAFEGREGGTPLDLVYGFDFWRGTYRYRFHDSPAWNLAVGGGLQLRNASISFETTDGENRVVSQDLGPVPVISVSGRYSTPAGFFTEATIEGFYAPVRYLNLRDVDVIGWLYDVGVRTGLKLDGRNELFLGVRALGGGSDGTGPEAIRWTQSQEDPRYTSNNLNTVALTLGTRVYLPAR